MPVKTLNTSKTFAIIGIKNFICLDCSIETELQAETARVDDSRVDDSVTTSLSMET